MDNAASGNTCTSKELSLNQSDQGSRMPAPLNFLHHVAKLKHLDRTGWVKMGIERPETVSGHMYRMAIMAGFLIEDSTLDVNKCIKMSLVHDLGESIVGDITPHCGVSNEEKNKLEVSAIERLSSLIPSTKAAELRNLFNEFEDAETEEAKFVHGLDKFDMILQAYEYELRENKPNFLQQFFESTKNFFASCHPVVRKLVDELYKARENNVPFTMFKR